MKDTIAKFIAKAAKIKESEASSLITTPKDDKMGDYSFPCFSLAKTLKKNPLDIAKEISKKIENNLEFEKVEAVGGYVNIFVNRTALAEETLRKIQKLGDKYGSSNLGKGKKIVIEFSSPNIGKPFGVHHLRSTIIGNSIAKISEFVGFKTIKLNYLGDWGTQFGKLLLGYKMFGDPEKLRKDPIGHMLELYVKVSANPDLEGEAREWFRKLEFGYPEAYALWEKFRAASLIEFNKIYDILGIKFDVISGESLYNKQMESTVKELEKKNILIESDGARVVNLEEYGLGVAIIKKSDGTTIYAARDIAAAIDRHKKYKFNKMFYEVGAEQTLHFRQVFKILELMGYSWAKDCKHISHGLYLDKDGKRFATRKGKAIFMRDILNEAIELSEKEILKRETKIPKKELQVRALVIALAGIFYGDLKNYRSGDVVFDIERFTSFEGDTGPYLLYSYARSSSILEKAKYNAKKKYKIANLTDSEKKLIFKLGEFERIVSNAYEGSAPNLIANYAFEIAQIFNEFYHANQVIGSENEQFRLVLVDSFSKVLKNSLSLLGIATIDKM